MGSRRNATKPSTIAEIIEKMSEKAKKMPKVSQTIPNAKYWPTLHYSSDDRFNGKSTSRYSETMVITEKISRLWERICHQAVRLWELATNKKYKHLILFIHAFLIRSWHCTNVIYYTQLALLLKEIGGLQLYNCSKRRRLCYRSNRSFHHGAAAQRCTAGTIISFNFSPTCWFKVKRYQKALQAHLSNTKGMAHIEAVIRIWFHIYKGFGRICVVYAPWRGWFERGARQKFLDLHLQCSYWVYRQARHVQLYCVLHINKLIVDVARGEGWESRQVLQEAELLWMCGLAWSVL